MSDKVKQAFEKHSSESEIYPGFMHRSMTLDQFRAALEEIVPSEEEAMQIAKERGITFLGQNGFMASYRWLRYKILGEKTQ